MVLTVVKNNVLEHSAATSPSRVGMVIILDNPQNRHRGNWLYREMAASRKDLL